MFNRILALGLMFLLGASLAVARPEPNSYLNERADSHADLMRQIQSDPVVMDRYERHFGLEPDQVVAYFYQLEYIELPEDGMYTVYNVPDSGEIRMRLLPMRKGEGIYADTQGNYILRASCGNPMVGGSSESLAVVPNDVALATVPEDAVAEMVSEETIVAEELSATIPPEVATPEVPVVAMSDTIAPPAPFPLEPLTTTSTSAAPFAGIGLAGLLIPASLGGAIALIDFDDTEPLPATDPIPEPASIIALAGGVAALMARKRKKSN